MSQTRTCLGAAKVGELAEAFLQLGEGLLHGGGLYRAGTGARRPAGNRCRPREGSHGDRGWRPLSYTLRPLRLTLFAARPRPPERWQTVARTIERSSIVPPERLETRGVPRFRRLMDVPADHELGARLRRAARRTSSAPTERQLSRRHARAAMPDGGARPPHATLALGASLKALRSLERQRGRPVTASALLAPRPHRVEPDDDDARSETVEQAPSGRRRAPTRRRCACIVPARCSTECHGSPGTTKSGRLERAQELRGGSLELSRAARARAMSPVATSQLGLDFARCERCSAS